ncbi:MAG: DEAD/DEAH box helicase [Actinomycetaceae bacterium]|nr:DEAD/DEAH box helicase [Actinomycetaceae bacterium]
MIEKNNNNDPACKATFASFGVHPLICEALENKGITTPFPIQQLTLPVALKQHDIIGQAKTGTGKTLGFALPILCTLAKETSEYVKPRACVIAPTRELAKQVAQDFRDAGKLLEVRVTEVYGGVGFDRQLSELKSGCDVVVGTPGRMIDLIKRRILDLSHVDTIVLDEADEMLDLGFLPDVERLMSSAKNRRHTMLFSATMPAPIVALARRYMNQPTHIRAQDPDNESHTVTNVRQLVYRCHEMNKIEVLARILQARERGLTIVFSQTKRAAQRVYTDLVHRGFACATIHGDLQQRVREKALKALRAGDVDVLVATDVAARGLDVDDVTHVINYQCPEDAKTYIHRIGRTARAGAKGTAITFVDWADTVRWHTIVRELKLDASLVKPVETYHTSEHLYSDVDIPRDTGGDLPQAQRTRKGLGTHTSAYTHQGHGARETGRGGGRGRSYSGGRSGGSAGRNRKHSDSSRRSDGIKGQQRRRNNRKRS